MKEKFYLSCFLATLLHFVPGAWIEYLQENEVVVNLVRSGEKRYHVFYLLCGNRRVLKLVSVNVPWEFTLELMRTVSTLTGGGVPVFSVEKEDEGYVPVLATGFLRETNPC